MAARLLYVCDVHAGMLTLCGHMESVTCPLSVSCPFTIIISKKLQALEYINLELSFWYQVLSRASGKNHEHSGRTEN